MHLIQFDIRYQFQSFLCRKRNQNSIRWQNGEKKNLGRKPGSVGGPVLLWPMIKQCMIMIQNMIQFHLV